MCVYTDLLSEQMDIVCVPGRTQTNQNFWHNLL